MWFDGKCLTQFRFTHQTIYNNRFPFLLPLVNGFHQVTQLRLFA